MLATAKGQRWDPAEVLRVLLAEEATGRDRPTIALRRRQAGFPTGKTIESFRAADSAIPAPTQRALLSLEWLMRAENLVVCGAERHRQVALRLGHAALDSGRPWPGSPWRAWPPSCATMSASTLLVARRRAKPASACRRR